LVLAIVTEMCKQVPIPPPSKMDLMLCNIVPKKP